MIQTDPQQANQSQRHLPIGQRFGRAVAVLLLSMVIGMNATPGNFGYLDTDGCACLVSYTTSQAQPTCAASRAQQCGFRLDQLLLFLSAVDFTP
jgi:hypothetical protein